MTLTTPQNGDRVAALERRHDIDALRVFAFALLILYHVGMFYVADWGWHVKSTYESTWLQVPMLFSNQWRMALIFLVSGLSVSFVWGKYHPGVFALRRFWRLLVPLLFGMAFIIAPQNYYEALAIGTIERGFPEFLGHYLTGYEFPPQTFDGDDHPGWTWNHLWYLPYLLSYTLVLIPIAMFLDGPGQALRTAFQCLRRTWLVVVPVLPLMLCGIFVFPHFPYIDHAFFDDWYAHAMYGTFFLYGFLIGRNNGLWAEFARLRWMTLGLAIVSFTMFLAFRAWLPEGATTWQQDQVYLGVVYLNRWLWIATLLGWGYQCLNRPRRWLPYATVAVYPWYILHQTIIVSAGYELSLWQLGPVIEPLLLLLATIAGCLIIHHVVVLRFSVLRVLFGVPVIIR